MRLLVSLLQIVLGSAAISDGLVEKKPAFINLPEREVNETTISASGTSALKAGRLMTLERCAEMLTPPQSRESPKMPLFWSKCGTEAEDACDEANGDATNPAYPELKGYHVILQILPANAESNYLKEFSQEMQEQADNAFWSACSQALGTLAEGRVYVMLPVAQNVLSENGTLDWAAAGVRPDSTFKNHEFPRLCRNELVTELVHISSVDSSFTEDLTAKIIQDRIDQKCPEPAAYPTDSSHVLRRWSLSLLSIPLYILS